MQELANGLMSPTRSTVGDVLGGGHAKKGSKVTEAIAQITKVGDIDEESNKSGNSDDNMPTSEYSFGG